MEFWSPTKATAKELKTLTERKPLPGQRVNKFYYGLKMGNSANTYHKFHWLLCICGQWVKIFELRCSLTNGQTDNANDYITSVEGGGGKY